MFLIAGWEKDVYLCVSNDLWCYKFKCICHNYNCKNIRKTLRKLCTKIMKMKVGDWLIQLYLLVCIISGFKFYLSVYKYKAIFIFTYQTVIIKHIAKTWFLKNSCPEFKWYSFSYNVFIQKRMTTYG